MQKITRKKINDAAHLRDFLLIALLCFALIIT